MQPFQNDPVRGGLLGELEEAFRRGVLARDREQDQARRAPRCRTQLVPEQPVYYGQQTVQFFPAEPDKARHEALEQKLREVYTPDRPVDVEYQTREGDASTEILRMANEIGSDVIVMGTHGRTGLRWLLAGSVAVAVLHGAACPVLALRTAEQPRPAKEIRVILHPTDFSVDSEAALRVGAGSPVNTEPGSSSSTSRCSKSSWTGRPRPISIRTLTVMPWRTCASASMVRTSSTLSRPCSDEDTPPRGSSRRPKKWAAT